MINSDALLRCERQGEASEQGRCSINTNVVFETQKQVKINTLQDIYIHGSKCTTPNSKSCQFTHGK